MDAHFSFIFKIQGFYPVSKKNKRLNLKISPFISKSFFLVHAVSSFLPTMLLLLIYAQYQKYDLTILLRVKAYIKHSIKHGIS